MRVRQRAGRASVVLAGVVAALAPAVAAAQEAHGRDLHTPGDAPEAVLITLGAIAAVMLLGTLGYLYRERRGLTWDFQRPDPEPPDHH